MNGVEKEGCEKSARINHLAKEIKKKAIKGGESTSQKRNTD